MSWERGAGFKITGVITRVFAASSGKFAALTIEAPNGRGGNKKVDVRAFSDAVDMVKNLGQGQVVKVTGTVDMETIKDKQRNPIKVDGREVWVPALTIRNVEVEPASAKPKPSTSAPAGDDW